MPATSSPELISLEGFRSLPSIPDGLRPQSDKRFRFGELRDNVVGERAKIVGSLFDRMNPDKTPKKPDTDEERKEAARTLTEMMGLYSHPRIEGIPDPNQNKPRDNQGKIIGYEPDVPDLSLGLLVGDNKNRYPPTPNFKTSYATEIQELLPENERLFKDPAKLRAYSLAPQEEEQLKLFGSRFVDQIKQVIALNQQGQPLPPQLRHDYTVSVFNLISLMGTDYFSLVFPNNTPEQFTAQILPNLKHHHLGDEIIEAVGGKEKHTQEIRVITTETSQKARVQRSLDIADNLSVGKLGAIQEMHLVEGLEQGIVQIDLRGWEPVYWKAEWETNGEKTPEELVSFQRTNPDTNHTEFLQAAGGLFSLNADLYRQRLVSRRIYSQSGALVTYVPRINENGKFSGVVFLSEEPKPGAKVLTEKEKKILTKLQGTDFQAAIGGIGANLIASRLEAREAIAEMVNIISGNRVGLGEFGELLRDYMQLIVSSDPDYEQSLSFASRHINNFVEYGWGKKEIIIRCAVRLVTASGGTFERLHPKIKELIASLESPSLVNKLTDRIRSL